MKVHVISSLRKFDDDMHYVRVITNTISASGASIALNWVESAIDRRERQVSHVEKNFDWSEIVGANLLAVRECDILIVEGSRFNYSQGFQTALALEYGKPVLNLYREDLPEYKEWPDKLFVSGISNPLFTSRAYKNEKDLEEIVTEFLQGQAAKTHELDVKLALNPETYNKLNQLAHNKNKTTNSIIKDILLESLDA